MASTVDDIVVVSIGQVGPAGPMGKGVPIGGTTGQILKKASGTDFDTAWTDFPEPGIDIYGVIASLPGHYERDRKWTAKSATERAKIISPTYLTVNIGNSGYRLTAQTELDLAVAATWDTALPIDYTVAASRVGKDFYIYACQQGGNKIPKFIVSSNSSVPSGYTTANSRLVGGFHCLCTDVGTITGHTLTGFLAGDILPASVWDLKHRPASAPEGMVYVDGLNMWVDIYLTSVTNTVMVSNYNGTVVTGTAVSGSIKFHFYKGIEWMGNIKKRPLYHYEFFQASMGSNQGTAIFNGTRPSITGGHIDSAGRRMISNVGCEDCCGAFWQWLYDSLSIGSTSWSNARTVIDSTAIAGYQSGTALHGLAGGAFETGANCGTRAWYAAASYTNIATIDNAAFRGCSVPA